MVVGIGQVSAKAAVRRRVGLPEQPPAGRDQAIDHGLDLVLAVDVVGQREGARSCQSGPPYVGLQGTLQPGAEHEAVHLVEDDLLVLEDRLPAEAFGVEPARSGQVRDAESDDGNLLLHGSRPFLHRRTTRRRSGSWDSTRARRTEPPPGVPGGNGRANHTGPPFSTATSLATRPGRARPQASEAVAQQRAHREGVAAAAVFIWAGGTMRAPTPEEISLKRFPAYVEEILGSGPAPYLLYPFRLVVRPDRCGCEVRD